MSYKDTTISIKYDLKADRDPWICAVKNQDIPLKGKKFTYNSGGLILHILDHLGHIPYSHVTLKVKEVKKKVEVLEERSEKIVEKVKKKVEVSGEKLGKVVKEYEISEERLEEAIKEYEISEERLEEVVEKHRVLEERLEKIVEEHEILKETLGELVEEHNNAREEYGLTLKLIKGKNKDDRLKNIENYFRKRYKEKQKI